MPRRQSHRPWLSESYSCSLSLSMKIAMCMPNVHVYDNGRQFVIFLNTFTVSHWCKSQSQCITDGWTSVFLPYSLFSPFLSEYLSPYLSLSLSLQAVTCSYGRSPGWFGAVGCCLGTVSRRITWFRNGRLCRLASRGAGSQHLPALSPSLLGNRKCLIYHLRLMLVPGLCEVKGWCDGVFVFLCTSQVTMVKLVWVRCASSVFQELRQRHLDCPVSSSFFGVWVNDLRILFPSPYGL